MCKTDCRVCLQKVFSFRFYRCMGPAGEFTPDSRHIFTHNLSSVPAESLQRSPAGFRGIRMANHRNTEQVLTENGRMDRQPENMMLFACYCERRHKTEQNTQHYDFYRAALNAGRPSHDKAVYPFVRMSNACFVTK